jgi:arylsulfatase A-like enzyme
MSDRKPPDEIEKHSGKYMCGWEEVRKRRHERLVDRGIIPASWRCSPRDERSPPWEGVANKEWEDARMACYAAQITIMDRGVGRILKTLQETGLYHNTVIFFLSDNGGEWANPDGCSLTPPRLLNFPLT